MEVTYYVCDWCNHEIAKDPFIKKGDTKIQIQFWDEAKEDSMHCCKACLIKRVRE